MREAYQNEPQNNGVINSNHNPCLVAVHERHIHDIQLAGHVLEHLCDVRCLGRAKSTGAKRVTNTAAAAAAGHIRQQRHPSCFCNKGCLHTMMHLSTKVHPESRQGGLIDSNLKQGTRTRDKRQLQQRTGGKTTPTLTRTRAGKSESQSGPHLVGVLAGGPCVRHQKDAAVVLRERVQHLQTDNDGVQNVTLALAWTWTWT
jgi:hypothetical protein